MGANMEASCQHYLMKHVLHKCIFILFPDPRKWFWCSICTTHEHFR